MRSWNGYMNSLRWSLPLLLPIFAAFTHAQVKACMHKAHSRRTAWQMSAGRHW